jgi:predicted kinase
LQKRVTEHRIRDCHGDLHAQHICFCQDLCIFDCIEFNARFRYCDIAAEVAFLSMDLEHNGRADLSRRFIQQYITLSKDAEIAALLRFYKCYHAYVRGKVTCFTLDDPLVSNAAKQRASEIALSYFDLSLAYTHPRPLLIIMIGLTGSGKTTIATALAKHCGAMHISSDVTRKRLAGIPETEHRYDEIDSGLYSPDFHHKTYDTIFAQTAEALEENHSVVLDAAFLKQAERERACKLAQQKDADLLLIECRLSAQLTQERLQHRLSQETASDGRWEVYQKQLVWFESVAHTPTSEHILIDTSLPLAHNIRRIMDRILKYER